MNFEWKSLNSIAYREVKSNRMEDEHIVTANVERWVPKSFFHILDERIEDKKFFFFFALTYYGQVEMLLFQEKEKKKK